MALIAVIMLVFSFAATLIAIEKISQELQQRLENYVRISSVGLEAPLWNFDHKIVEGYLDSLMLDATLVFASVQSSDGTVITRTRPELGEMDFIALSDDSNYSSVEMPVFKEGRDIGTIQLAVSREAVRQEIVYNITAIVVLAVSVLATIAVASVLIARRYITRPLAALQSSAAAIGSGELTVPIDTEGKDEIGELARDFDGMRNSIRGLVSELKLSNDRLESANLTLEDRVEQRTKEVLTTQQKLVDAIESTSEGFAFFDAHDQLVLYNAQYKTLLYGGSDVEIEPGMSFEEILRLGLKGGLIPDKDGDEEAFIKRRIEKYHNPGPPFLQRRGKDFWLQISERKTSDGGTVAVFSDVSQLKNREFDLTQKTAALEHLSSQLAKYLSPQVYGSIFRGEQEVTVASSRKKLTVFFSDIVGFTETAESMESEELTTLLNSYLTEMSKIALEHGATIDKYIGDAILIFFGDPETHGVKQDALACVKMAMAMSDRMKELQIEWENQGILQPLQCRMGIHTDYCTVGNFGSESRMDYTIIGRGVNTASRLETAADPGKILISYATHAQVKDVISCTSKGSVDVKGIVKPIEVYEVDSDLQISKRDLSKITEADPNIAKELGEMTEVERKKFESILRKLLDQVTKEPKNPASPKKIAKRKSY